MISKNKTILFASVIATVIIASSLYGTSIAYADDEYYDDEMSWYVENHKYELEKIDIIQKAHNVGLVSDEYYFYDLLWLWDAEQILISQVTYYDLDTMDGEDAKWIKNAIKNPIAQNLIDELISSQ